MRRSRAMYLLTWLLVSTFGPISVFAQKESCENFDSAAADRLIKSTNLRELDHAFEAARHLDLPLLALYRSRRLDLNPTSNEELRYLHALPKSRDELYCVYRLTYAREVSETVAVSETIYDMFDRAAALTRKRGFGYKRILRLALWADGELGEVAWDWYPLALQEDGPLVVAAIKQLSHDEQLQLCGRDVRALSEQEVVRHCKQVE